VGCCDSAQRAGGQRLECGGFYTGHVGLPLLNGGLALRAFISRRRVAALLFVLCTLLWGGWAIFFITDTVLSFHKIGG
jgi:hypothetical protein